MKISKGISAYLVSVSDKAGRKATEELKIEAPADDPSSIDLSKEELDQAQTVSSGGYLANSSILNPFLPKA